MWVGFFLQRSSAVGEEDTDTLSPCWNCWCCELAGEVCARMAVTVVGEKALMAAAGQNAGRSYGRCVGRFRDENMYCDS